MTELPDDERAGETDRGVIELRADVTECDDAPNECTIWPHNASGSALLTQWITAQEGSFVALDDMR